MRLVRFLAKCGPANGILQNDEVVELSEVGYASLSSCRAVHRAAGIRLLAPCVPTKVIAVGLNYRDHAGELEWRCRKPPSSS
jgi:2-keto-4-pentenoate hydratase/2-oxohepta-3-ene-1,7-dioic acid hydratase in catechol pathway